MKKYKTILPAVLTLAIIASCNIIIDTVAIDQKQPDGSMAPKIEAGKTATFTITGHIESPANRDPDQKFVMAMLAPADWDTRNNMAVTMHCDGTFDKNRKDVSWDQEWTLSPIALDDKPANMPNYTWSEALDERFGTPDGMEWVAFITDDCFGTTGDDTPRYEITVTGPVGTQNLKTVLSFFTNTYYDGMNSDSQYWDMKRSGVFTVYNGEGEEQVFGNTEHFYKVYPHNHVQTDLVTYRFMGDTYPNELNGSDVYISATAHTKNGKDIKKTAQMFRKEGNEYVLTIWPCRFFNIDADDTIESVDFEYTNLSGSVVVNKAYEAKLFDGEVSGNSAYNDIYTCQ